MVSPRKAVQDRNPCEVCLRADIPFKVVTLVPGPAANSVGCRVSGGLRLDLA